MVKALIDIDQHTNQVINMVKVKYNLNDKSDAIEKMAEEYEEFVLEPPLRPEFIEKMKKRQKEKVHYIEDFGKEFGLR